MANPIGMGRSAGSRRRRAAAAVGALAVLGPAVVLGLAGPARAGSGTATTPDAAEAWYSSAPVSRCSSPLGCPTAVPTSPYAKDTLHVGVAGGQESARTYVVPDLSGVPFGATLTTGTMTLPVATDTKAGSFQPQTATLTACLVTEPVTDGVDGSSDTPPAVDAHVCSPARYSPAGGGRFTVNLAPLLSRWAAGAPQDGVALLPDLAKAGPATVWHVALDGRKRSGTPHISSALQFTIAPIVSVPAGPLAPAPVAAPPPTAVSPQLASDQAGSVAQQPPPVIAKPAPQAQQPVALSRPLRYQYPLAFLLPLAFLAGAVFLFRLFTGDARPAAVRA